MAQCKNCKTNLSCSCKIRTALDGTSCCTKCVDTYNNKSNTLSNGHSISIQVKHNQ